MCGYTHAYVSIIVLLLQSCASIYRTLCCLSVLTLLAVYCPMLPPSLILFTFGQPARQGGRVSQRDDHVGRRHIPDRWVSENWGWEALKFCRVDEHLA